MTLELLQLYNKAFSKVPNSKAQLEIIKEINKIRKDNEVNE